MFSTDTLKTIHLLEISYRKRLGFQHECNCYRRLCYWFKRNVKQTYRSPLLDHALCLLRQKWVCGQPGVWPRSSLEQVRHQLCHDTSSAVGRTQFTFLTVFIFLLLFCLIGAKITQTSSLVLKEDGEATLKCSQNDNHNYMSWYLQQPGKGLQLLYYSIGADQEAVGDTHPGYKATRLNLSDFHLVIKPVKMNHSADYFCASSLDTTLQSHLLSLHKLFSPSPSLRREQLSAQENGLQANSLFKNHMLLRTWTKTGKVGAV